MAEIDWSREKEIFLIIGSIVFLLTLVGNLDVVLSGNDFVTDIFFLLGVCLFNSVFSAIFFRVLFLSGKYLYDLYYAETITHMPKSQIDSFFSGDIREFTLHGVGLLEPRSSRQSVGVGVGKGGVGIGTSKSFFSGEEQTKIDSGRIHFDNEKIQFIGATNQISWAWKKIVSVSIAHGIMDSMIFIGVSSRKKISGFTIRNEKEEAKSLADKILEKSKS